MALSGAPWLGAQVWRVFQRRLSRGTPDVMAKAVRLVLEEDRSIPQATRDLDLTESALRLWEPGHVHPCAHFAQEEGGT